MKKITLILNEQSIDNAIKELQNYKKWVNDKCQELKREVAKAIADTAQNLFDSSYVETSLRGANYPASVSVTIDEQDDICIVMANGTDAVWVEFGAGVYYNTPAGTSPEPHGEELGLTIGSFSEKHNGEKQVWGYRDAEGNIILTHGTKATMPMYNAVQTVVHDLPDIAKRVFAND